MQDMNLARLIHAYAEAQASWLATTSSDGDLRAEGIEYSTLEALGNEIIFYRCTSLESIKQKVIFLLDTSDLYYRVREDVDDAGDLLRIFLMSLLNVDASARS